MNRRDRTRRIRKALLGAPVPAKVMGIALGLTILFGASLFWQIDKTWRGLAVFDLEQGGRYFANHMAIHCAPLVRRGELTGLQRLVDEVGDANSEVNFVQILDGHGRVLATSAPVDPSQMSGPEVSIPLGKDVAGAVRVVMRQSHVAFELQWLTRRLTTTSVVVAIIGMALAWWLTRIFTRPIRELIRATRALNKGAYDARAPVRAMDEIGELAGAFNDMASALERKEALRGHLLRRVIDAAEDERKRVARELHDHTGQALTSLIAGLGALKDRPDPRQANELLTLATETLGEVHDLSFALRPSALDDLGLVAALQKHCEGVAQRHDIRVNCEAVGLDDGERLAGEIEVALYRIVQEALTNAVRHGRARFIEVLLQRKNAALLAVIEDDGRGSDARDWRGLCERGGHLGLLGIEERAKLLGGRLSVESQVGSPTRLFVEIPLEEKYDA